MEQDKSEQSKESLEDRIIYKGPSERAEEFRNLAKRLIESRAIVFKPSDIMHENYHERDFNKEAKLLIEYRDHSYLSTPQLKKRNIICIRPYQRTEYVIDTINLPPEDLKHGVKINFFMKNVLLGYNVGKREYIEICH